MKKTIFGCLGAAAVAFALHFTMANVQAGLFSSCNPCDEVACNPCDEAACDPCDAVCGTKAGQWFLNGHMEAGFFANGHGNTSFYGYNPNRDGATPSSGNTANLMNTRLTGAQVNQVYVSMGKAVDGRRGLDIGGTVDFSWGSDAYIVQAAGMEFNNGSGDRYVRGMDGEGRWGKGDYFAAFPQAYVEVAYKRWNVIAGKYYAPFGSSHYKSTDNFFYSWASTAKIAPHVGTGAYATYKVSDTLSVTGGWVQPEEFGESSKNNAVLGGFDWTPSKRLKVHYAFAAGKNTYSGADHYSWWEPGFDPSEDGSGAGDTAFTRAWAGDKYFVQSLVTTAQINKRLQYVFEWTYFQNRTKGTATAWNEIEDEPWENAGTTREIFGIYAYGINNELIYQYNKKWAFGARFGMLTYGKDATDWYTVGLGANWTPNKWLVVKPELRYDWTDKPAVTMFNRYNSTYQLSGGMSAVVKF